MTVTVGVDVGGTFTDVILLDGATVVTAKVLSTPGAFEQGVLSGLEAVLTASGAAPAAIDALYHGTTVATNAVLEGRGARTALVTTAGFRDSLELGRGRRPHMYGLRWVKPVPLVSRQLRVELEQRITHDGQLDPAFDHADVATVAARLRAAGAESIAVCLINSYQRPDEERAVAAAVARHCPGIPVSASVDLTPEPGEYERASTAVVNAYVAPEVRSYLGALEDGFAALGVDAPFFVIQSNGALTRSSLASEQPVHLIESGPAAGVTATVALTRRLGLDSAIAFDMGGTTAKATLVEHGAAFETSEYEVGAGMNARRGLHGGAGYPVRTSSLDIAEVGAGGGSVFWIDPGGAPHVGPQSAGAAPGPACYGLGGTEPTLSDAKLVLGYLSPDAIAGGRQTLDRELAERSLQEVAERLGLSLLDAALGAVAIAVANMTRLVKAVTTERGRDPRDSTLVAFGGAGPAYAVALARSLGIATVLVPPIPGLFSAAGLLVADPRHDAVRSYTAPTIEPTRLGDLFTEMETQIRDLLDTDSKGEDTLTFQRFADMRYQSQSGSLRIPVPFEPITAETVATLLDRLDAEHYATFAHRKARTAATVTAVRVQATYGTAATSSLQSLAAGSVVASPSPTRTTMRDAYFGPDGGLIATPVIGRHGLDDTPTPGPLIIEEMDSTTVVPPGASARRDVAGNVVIDA